MIRPFIQPRTCRMGWSAFSAMSRLKFASNIRDFLSSMPPIERKNGEKCTECVSDYCAYPSWVLPTNPGAPPLNKICRNPCHCGWVQRWLWRQSIGHISLKPWHQTVSPKFHSPDKYSSLICYVPYGLGVQSIKLLKWRLVKRRIWFFHKLCCEEQWSGLLYIS